MKTKDEMNCPVCGAKNSVKKRNHFKDIVTPDGYSSIEVGPLNGLFCNVCGEGFLDKESEKVFDKQVAEGKARQDSKRLVAADIIDVEFAVKHIKVSRRRIHKMMEEGKLPYVFIGDRRYPIKNISIFNALSKTIRTHSGQKPKKVMNKR